MSRTAPPPRATAGRHRTFSRPVRRAGWRGFVDRYGWRAYALPILTVITAGALVRGNAPAPHENLAGSQQTGQSHSASGTQVEGLNARDAGYRPGATPAPITINLAADRATSCATNNYRQLILVSISRQHLWVCSGPKQINQTPVTTGSVVNHDQTPIGSWRVQAKQRDRYLIGPGYKDYVHFWMPFDGDFGLHDAPWQTMPFGSSQWRTNGSHGCVHVPAATMAWIYRWAQVGGTVVTIER